jgi:deferrochelatase/peroxidase EfeB
MDLNRRSFLKGGLAGAAGTALAGGVLAAGVQADASPAAAATVADRRFSFYGAHQAGIVTPLTKQDQSTFASFDVTASSKAELRDLMQTLTERVRFLMTGGMPPDLGVSSPPADSDVLGPVVPSDGLTVTLGLGASLFDDRFGLGDAKPQRLRRMPTFVNDDLDPKVSHGDLMLQICADHQDTVHHALRDIAKHTRGGMQPKWRLDGFNSPERPTGNSRNLLGFKDGTANPAVQQPQVADELIWVADGQGEPGWAVGGSYQTVRLIRMFIEFWDRVSLNEQQNMFGRFRDSGAPLDGSKETDTPDYAADPRGQVIPLDSHIRRANPRTPATANQRMLRRSYNYDRGIDANGDLDVGHLFVVYNQDNDRQFVTVQERLANEPLVDYVQPFGGGFFFAVPGVSGPSDYYAKGLFA